MAKYSHHDMIRKLTLFYPQVNLLKCKLISKFNPNILQVGKVCSREIKYI